MKRKLTRLEDRGPVMDADRLLELADTIQKVGHRDLGFAALTGPKGPDPETMFKRPRGFNMLTTNCGTAGCICGWTLALWGEEKDLKNYDNPLDWAADLLGINRALSFSLFIPAIEDYDYKHKFPLENIGAREAANVLRRIVKYGPDRPDVVLDFWREELMKEHEWWFEQDSH